MVWTPSNSSDRRSRRFRNVRNVTVEGVRRIWGWEVLWHRLILSPDFGGIRCPIPWAIWQSSSLFLIRDLEAFKARGGIQQHIAKVKAYGACELDTVVWVRHCPIGVIDPLRRSWMGIHRAQIAGRCIRPLTTKVKTRAEALGLKNLHRSRMRVVGYESLVVILQRFAAVLTYVFGGLGGPGGHVLLDVLNDLTGLDMLASRCLTEVLLGLDVCDKLLLPNGLANRWVELLEL